MATGRKASDPDWHWSCVCAAPEGPGPCASVGGERIRFTSAILPRFARRTRVAGCGFAERSTSWRCPAGTSRRRWQALLGKDASGDVGAGNRQRLKAPVGGRARALAPARPVGPTLRLHVGRWHLSPGSAGGREAMHSGPHRRHAGRTPRNSWASRRGCARAPRAGVELLAMTCAGAGSRLVPSSPSAMALWASGRRWRRSFPTPADQRLLGPQDSQCLEQAGEVATNGR